MNFSIPVTVDQATVEDTYILLENISYTHGELVISSIKVINWSSLNTNIDSDRFPYLSSSTDEKKVISSDLSSDHPANFTFTTARSCNTLSEIKFDSTYGTDVTWNGNEGRKLCDDGTFTFINLGLPGTFTITYGTSSLATTLLKILIIFLAIALVIFAVAGIMYYVNDDFKDVDPMSFVKYAISLLVVTILIVILINHIVNSI